MIEILSQPYDKREVSTKICEKFYQYIQKDYENIKTFRVETNHVTIFHDNESEIDLLQDKKYEPYITECWTRPHSTQIPIIDIIKILEKYYKIDYFGTK